MLTLNGICWCLLVSFGVWRRLFVSYGVWRCEEGVWGVSKRISECCLWTCLRFGSLCESIWVFRLCMVQQLLNIGKSPEGKIPHTWHFWNLKIQKPPYISFLKIIGLLHFFKFMGPSEENYNQQSLWITLYILARHYWRGITDPFLNCWIPFGGPQRAISWPIFEPLELI